jgi:ubiquinone/menaquinone biosynthesis C-methylase UbiE
VKKKTVFHLLKAAGCPITNRSILEIGFGSGEVLLSFDRSCKIYGLELSNSAIHLGEQKAAEKGFQDYEFKYSHGETIDYPDNSFDYVIASHIIEHVVDDVALLKEIHRVLRPGGSAVLLIPINEKYPEPNHYRKYTPADFISLLNKCSFNKIALSVENLVIYRLIEKFYRGDYNQRWKIIGPLIVAAFNIPTSLLSYSLNLTIDLFLMRISWLPMQYGCIVRKE